MQDAYSSEGLTSTLKTRISVCPSTCQISALFAVIVQNIADWEVLQISAGNSKNT
jgi:hypothetical protein